MSWTGGIGWACNKVIRLIVRGLALSKIHPNVLTFLGLVINVGAAVLLASGQFRWAGVVIGAHGSGTLAPAVPARPRPARSPR